jgi:DNA-binding NarL/FixJ family response regulator
MPSAQVETTQISISAQGDLPEERLATALTAAGWNVEEAAADDVDVVVLAHERADGGVCSEIRERGGSSKGVIVLVVENASAAEVRRALQAGARAIVSAASLEEALIPSVRAALAGQIVIPAVTGARGAPALLTVREKQVLALVVMGMSNAEIASKLFLAESTVKSHLSSAFAKLGVSSRSEAAGVILDPESGTGLGILTIPTEQQRAV